MLQQDHNYSVKLISRTDLENLAEWKNANRASFNYQGFITAEMQSRWYLKYLKRCQLGEDFMYMVKYGDISIGCAGFRLKHNIWDGYNIIRGRDLSGSKGIMTQALIKIINNAWDIEQIPFSVDVLNKNPAIDWYLACGFQLSGKNDKFTVLTMDPKDL